MKKIAFKISFIVGIIVFIVFSIQVFANSRDKVISTETKEINELFNEESENILELYDIKFDEIDNVSEMKVVEDWLLNRTVKRIKIKNLQIDFEDNKIVQIINEDDFKKNEEFDNNFKDEKLEEIEYEITDVSQIQDTISKIEDVHNLQEYKLVSCHNDLISTWSITWNKVLFDDVLNPYDAVTVSIDAKDGSIINFVRKTVEPENINVLLTKEDAFEIAKTLFKDELEINDTEILLTIFRPNYYWSESEKEEADFIRVAWKIIVDKKTIIMVDAENGEILGGDQTLSDGSRAMALVPTGYNASYKATDMAAAFSSLGYYQPYACQPHCGWVTKQDVMWVINHPQLYGLYINAHGLGDANGNYVNAIGDGVNWELYATEVSGNWHFVYLDCCFTSSTNNFANAFHTIGYTNRVFVGHNNEVLQSTSYEFTWRFAGLLSSTSNSVFNCAVLARDAVIVSGYADCNPGVLGDLSYDGSSW